MPVPTHAPETAGPRSPMRPGRAGGMSRERRYRLRRSLVALAVISLLAIGWWAIKALTGEAAAVSTTTPTSAAPASKETLAADRPPSQPEARPSVPVAAAGAGGSARRATTSVPASGDGKLTLLTVPGRDSGRDGRVVTFSVEAEGGLGLDLDELRTQVRRVLSDERGWETKDHVHFVARTPSEVAAGKSVDIRITLVSPDLTDKLCAPLLTMGEVSCNHNGRAVINAKRWAQGVEYYDDLDRYRTYVINHEVGHGLWHPHADCPGPGERAPIMVQQTLGLHGCLAWPYPVGA